MLGVVHYVDEHSHKRKIDFLGNAFGKGLGYEKIQDTGVKASVDDENFFQVMQPVLSMESRAHNVAGLPDQYNTELGLAQLRASIACAKEYLLDILDSDPTNGAARVRKFNKQIFQFSAYDSHALAVYRDHGIDVFAALLVDSCLPQAFLDSGYDEWASRVAKERAKRT